MAETTVRIELDVATEYRPIRMAGGKGDTPEEKTAQEAKKDATLSDLPYVKNVGGAVNQVKNLGKSIADLGDGISIQGTAVGGIGIALVAVQLAKKAISMAENIYDIFGGYDMWKQRAEAQYLRNRSGNAYYRRGQ